MYRVANPNELKEAQNYYWCSECGSEISKSTYVKNKGRCDKCKK